MDKRTATAKTRATMGDRAGMLCWRALMLILCTAPLSVNGAPQSAGEILDEAVARYNARLADVANYTLVRRVNNRDSVAYYERREKAGVVTFEPVSSLRLALESGAFDNTPLAALAPGGDVLEGLRDALIDALLKAGVAALEQQLAGAASGQVASLVDALIRHSEPGTGGTPGSLVDGEALKEALVEGALRAGMTQFASRVLGLPTDAGQRLLEAVRGKASPGELLGELAGTVLGSAGPAGGMPALPGSQGSAMMSGNPLQAGIGAIANIGGQLLTRHTMSAAERVLTPRYMNDIDFYSAMQQIKSRASLDGTERVDGRKAWVLTVDDLRGIDGAQELRDGRMRLWLDRSLYVPLRAEFSGQTKMEGRWQPVNMTVVRANYVKADGMLFPGRSTTTIAGPERGNGMFSDSERGELERKMATGMRQLEKLPEQYRAVAQQMIGSRMAQLEGMMGQGPMQFDSTLIEVRVNEGPPPELVEQAKVLFSTPRQTRPGAGPYISPESRDTLPWLRQ